MRQALITFVVLLSACASASPPPGGPEDKTPPTLLRVTPDTNALNVHPDNVSFFFDKVINDRGTGAQEVDSYFLVSPSDGAPNVNWHRSRIDVRPRHGFRDNTAYTITLLPGLSDLRNNRMKDGMTLVFSTGATIPKERITGIAFDWVAEKPAQAFIEAITPDSITYLAQADSLGKFVVGPLSPGTYLVRGFLDANNNRALDRNEAFDTVRVIVPQAKPLELLTALRDTLPARILSVALSDSLTLSATFDHALDPTQSLSPQQFRLVGPDSQAVPIVSTRSPREEHLVDSTKQKLSADSVRRADSLAGKALPPVIETPPKPANAKTPPPPPKPSLPPPFTVVLLRLTHPLPPNTLFRLSTTGIRALSGRVQPSERSFTTPKPPPPKPKADSTAKGAPAAPAAAKPPASR